VQRPIGAIPSSSSLTFAASTAGRRPAGLLAQLEREQRPARTNDGTGREPLGLADGKRDAVEGGAVPRPGLLDRDSGIVGTQHNMAAGERRVVDRDRACRVAADDRLAGKEGDAPAGCRATDDGQLPPRRCRSCLRQSWHCLTDEEAVAAEQARSRERRIGRHPAAGAHAAHDNGSVATTSHVFGEPLQDDSAERVGRRLEHDVLGMRSQVEDERELQQHRL